MHQYQTKEHPDYGFLLVKDGREVFCPFQPAITTQGPQGTNIMRLPCSTNCPLASVEKVERELYDINTGETSVEPSVVSDVVFTTSCGCEKIKYNLIMVVNEMKAV